MNRQSHLWTTMVNICTRIGHNEHCIAPLVTNTTDSTSTSTAAPVEKMITVREPLQFEMEYLDYADPTEESHANSLKK